MHFVKAKCNRPLREFVYIQGWAKSPQTLSPDVEQDKRAIELPIKLLCYVGTQKMHKQRPRHVHGHAQAVQWHVYTHTHTHSPCCCSGLVKEERD